MSTTGASTTPNTQLGLAAPDKGPMSGDRRARSIPAAINVTAHDGFTHNFGLASPGASLDFHTPFKGLRGFLGRHWPAGALQCSLKALISLLGPCRRPFLGPLESLTSSLLGPCRRPYLGPLEGLHRINQDQGIVGSLLSLLGPCKGQHQ
jgi:hypothetical protein